MIPSAKLAETKLISGVAVEGSGRTKERSESNSSGALDLNTPVLCFPGYDADHPGKIQESFLEGSAAMNLPISFQFPLK